ncbi:MAG TPA: thermonuclease family protein [Pyrinomonadaceae bacterium]|nr:thermonuclease family protein [Pyrinomonadaceae bacterium]
MKNLRLTLLISLILLIAGSGYAQRKFEGRVVQVLDGKTVVIDSDTGKITAELQYVEIPEPENPLSKTVRGHLEDLVLDKEVAFHLQGFSFVKMTGQIYLGDVDIAQQMLRDGAAWHLPAGQNSQSKQASDLYDSTQELAKNEKRGIWSNENSKPAGLIRAENYENALRQEQYARDHAGANSSGSQANFVEPARRENRRPGKWGDKNPKLGNIGALLNGYNAETKTGYLSTSFLGSRNLGSDDPDHEMAIDFTYLYREDDRKGRTGRFVLTLDSISKEWAFLRSNNLILTIGDKDTVVGKPRRQAAKAGDMFRERLTYEVNRATIEKIYNGGDVSFRVGMHVFFPEQGLQLLLYNMLQVTQ